MTQDHVDQILQEIRREFGGEAEAEQIATGRFRFALVSPSFTGMPHLERQDKVWALVDRVVPRQITLDISLILTYSPDELVPT